MFAFPQEVARLTEEAASLYATFDVETFNKEFGKLYPAGRDDSARADVAKKLVGIEAKIDRHKTKASDCLRKIPEHWQEWRLTEPGNPAAVAEHCHTVVTRSVADWRRLSQSFGCPVTPSGILIASFDSPYREQVSRAYKSLGLTPSQNPVFVPTDFQTNRPCGYDDVRIGAGRMIVHQPS